MVFVGAYLGAPGSMRLFAHLKGSSSESSARASSAKVTLGGRQRVQVSPQVLREWSCSLPLATPEESQHLKAIASGVFGLGPFAWVPVQATATNVLSLGASMPGPSHRSWSGAGDASGAWQVPGLGLVRHSVVADGATVILGAGTPVVPGLPVTGGAYVSGTEATRVVLQLMDASGSIVVSQLAPGSAAVAAGRFTATVDVAPPSVVSARLAITGAMQVGLPSISWTPRAAAWVPGGGSTQVIVEGFDADVKHVSDWQGVLEDVSFTVKELTSDA